MISALEIRFLHDQVIDLIRDELGGMIHMFKVLCEDTTPDTKDESWGSSYVAGTLDLGNPKYLRYLFHFFVLELLNRL